MSSSRRRPGVILLVVLLLLALFAAVGLAFVFYADSSGLAARLHADSQTQRQADVDPELLLAYFLRQFVYDVPDDASGVFSALRGHSLARNLYGCNSGPASRAGAQAAANIVPFNGTGRLHAPSPFGTLVPGLEVDDFQLVNYTYYADDPLLPPSQRFLRDPERLGWRAADLSAQRAPFAGGFNVPYTYPDLNAAFLAAVRADGTVLLPSFHRPWTVSFPGSGLGPNGGDFYDRATGQLNSLWSANPSVMPPWFKYTTLRPLPALNPGFPSPEDGGGDVKNLAGPGTLRRLVGSTAEYWNNDSFWIDLDFPVLRAPDGRLYKPLFAPLVMDLDSRINLNVHGSASGTSQAWSPPEANLGQLFTQGTGSEWRNLLQGPRAQAAHAALTGERRAFALSNMEAALRYGDTGSLAMTSGPFGHCPVNFAQAAIRGQVTTQSFDVGRPGVAPWLREPATYAYAALPTLDPDQPETPLGPPVPALATTGPGAPPGEPRLANAEVGPVDWRNVSAAIGRVDLSRPLPPYPHQGSGQAPPFGPPLTQSGSRPVLDLPFHVDAPGGPIWKQFVLAQRARQRLAEDIYRRLLVATGAPPIQFDQNPQEPPAEVLQTRRWLAQLAVNIVDAIDEDDISTPFLFYTVEDYRPLPLQPRVPPDPDRVSRPDSVSLPGRGPADLQWPMYWVFGTELPRVLVNEVLAQVGTNDSDNTYADEVRVFVELHDPFARTPPGSSQADPRPVPLRMGSGPTMYAPYRILLGTNAAAPMRSSGAAILPGVANDNVLGSPEPGTVRQATRDVDFAFAPGMTSPGFCLLGPPPSVVASFALQDPFTTGLPGGTPILRTPSLEYPVDFPVRQPNDAPDERTEGVSVIVRRLANPYLPFDPQRRLATSMEPNLTYNPFLTVDYVDGVALQTVAAGGPTASTGRFQPYAAYRGTLQTQASKLQHPLVQCTFGRINNPSAAAYQALSHLDRRPTSPLELLTVSGHQPYQLTQRFIGPGRAGSLTANAHRAPWLDDGLGAGGSSYRLYRLFEFLEIGTDQSGAALLGRVPGRVNLNTLWDPEVFRALCDAQSTNQNAVAAVEDVFSRGIYDSTGTVAGVGRRTRGLIPGRDDQPFQGFAAGTSPAVADRPPARGLEDTVLRLRTLGSSTDANLGTDLVTRIAGMLTSRSNTFAIWLTVGFFEVTDTTTRPARLGAEIGRDVNRHVRHRMFAIVDRSNLSIASCVAELSQPVQLQIPYPFPNLVQRVTVSALNGSVQAATGGAALPWQIARGTMLVVDAGTNQETVEVLAVDTARSTLDAVFTKAHAAGAPISLADTAGVPPVFFKPLSVEGPALLAAPPFEPALPHTLTVRVAADRGRSSAAVLAGTYGNLPWTIRPGTNLIIDVGPNQEVVTVQRAGFALDPQAATGSFQIVVTRPHAEGFTIANTFLGNPGPQRRFDPRNPLFAAVVRYLSIIQ